MGRHRQNYSQMATPSLVLVIDIIYFELNYITSKLARDIKNIRFEMVTTKPRRRIWSPIIFDAQSKIDYSFHFFLVRRETCVRLFLH